MAESRNASEIEVLEDLEAVRRRPQLYLSSYGQTDVPSRLALQSLCHAIDEAVSGSCRSIEVTLIDRGRAVIAYDAGMPLCTANAGAAVAAHILLSVLYACRAEKRHFKVGDSVCSLGLAVLNALSASLVATIVSNGEHCVLAYQRGKLIAPPSVQVTDAPNHTRIEFELDATILGPELEISRILMERELETWRAEFAEMPPVRFIESRGSMR